MAILSMQRNPQLRLFLNLFCKTQLLFCKQAVSLFSYYIVKKIYLYTRKARINKTVHIFPF